MALAPYVFISLWFGSAALPCPCMAAALPTTTGGRVAGAWAALPACTRAGLAAAGICVDDTEALSALFGDETDLQSVMDQLDPAGSLGRQHFGDALRDLRDAAEGPAGTKRRRRAAVLPSLQTMAVGLANEARGRASQASAGAELEAPVRSVGAPKASWRNKLQSLLASADPQERSAVEETQRILWSRRWLP